MNGNPDSLRWTDHDSYELGDGFVGKHVGLVQRPNEDGKQKESPTAPVRKQSPAVPATRLVLTMPKKKQSPTAPAKKQTATALPWWQNPTVPAKKRILTAQAKKQIATAPVKKRKRATVSDDDDSGYESKDDAKFLAKHPHIDIITFRLFEKGKIMSLRSAEEA
ncbi:hypothetical protein MMC28_008999 [Mycoblastus sanguinarius]|nr:hypothetical protein [Mycoblastus sanguinarius]